MTDTEIERAHLLDDMERMRTHVLRMLLAHHALLRDGLHALRDDRPHITDEFVVRTIDAMLAEIQYLTNEGQKGTN